MAPLHKAVKRMIGPLKDHPALLAWYVWDEPNAPGYVAAPPEVVRALADALEQEDPRHPTFFCFTPWHNLGRIDSYGACRDIMAVDPYVGAKYLGLVPKSVEAARRAGGPDRPVWSIVWTAHNAGQMRPTVPLTRCATYLSLIHGATGIFFYGHKGEPGKQGPAPGREDKGWQRGVGEPEMADLAELIAQLSAEVRVLAPALLAKRPSRRIAVEPTDGPIHVAELETMNRRILLTANATEKPVRATFQLQGRAGATSVRVMFENRQVALNAGAFVDDFDPLATHAYEMMLEPR